MSELIAYEDAVDLLDADHKMIKKMFIEYSVLVEDEGSGNAKRAVALRICNALTLHTGIEEEIFYPEVRKFIRDDPLMDAALQEHAEAKTLIAELVGMKTVDGKHDGLVKKLGAAIDEHVLEEREQIFLKARYAPMDLKALVIPLLARKQKLSKKSGQKSAKEAT